MMSFWKYCARLSLLLLLSYSHTGKMFILRTFEVIPASAQDRQCAFLHLLLLSVALGYQLGYQTQMHHLIVLICAHTLVRSGKVKSLAQLHWSSSESSCLRFANVKSIWLLSAYRRLLSGSCLRHIC